ncbi:MAG: hypothetical protein IIA70_04590, partial [Proteobacteria bacterium]|nr:hypothetical protein [Pseudomonadota bacterium]
LRDEPAELCRGHVINDKFGTCKIWIPQRADVDSFFGSTVEADLISAVQDRNKNPVNLWINPQLRRKHRPWLEMDGKVLRHYFPEEDAGRIKGQTLVRLENEDGVGICNLAVKTSQEAIIGADGRKLELIIERDYRPAVIASVLKAAHLTMFRMLLRSYAMSIAAMNTVVTFTTGARSAGLRLFAMKTMTS